MSNLYLPGDGPEWTLEQLPADVAKSPTGYSMDVIIRRTFVYTQRVPVNKPITPESNFQALHAMLTRKGAEQAMLVSNALALPSGTDVEAMHKIIDVRFFPIDS